METLVKAQRINILYILIFLLNYTAKCKKKKDELNFVKYFTKKTGAQIFAKHKKCSKYNLLIFLEEKQRFSFAHLLHISIQFVNFGL